MTAQLCSMCQHGTTKHRACRTCGVAYCRHLIREHEANCRPAVSSSPKSHPCSACGGTGEEHIVSIHFYTGADLVRVGRFGNRDAADRRYREYGSDCKGRKVETFTCPVCLGTGSFSDVPTNEDAIADAECLRQAWDIVYDRAAGEFVITDLTERATARLWCDGSFGLPGVGRYLPWECYDSAVDAARAAFRAVPGLRG